MNPESKKKLGLLELNQLKDKLLDLSSRSRKIRFRPSKWFGWDLTELLNHGRPELVNNFSVGILNLLTKKETETSSAKFSLNLTPFFKSLTPEENLKFRERIIGLQRKNIWIYQEKGYKALFLGTVFLRGYFRNQQKNLCLVNAPLFFLRSDFEKTKDLNLIFAAPKKINYNLLYYLKKELGLATDKLLIFLERLEQKNASSSHWKNYLLFVNEELQELVATSQVKIGLSPAISSWLDNKEFENNSGTEKKASENSEKNFGSSETDWEEEIDSHKISHYKVNDYWSEPFSKLTLNTKPANYSENKLEITLNFCLTIDSEPNLSLFRDFEEIIQEYSENNLANWPASALNLLSGEESILTYPEEKETEQQPLPLYFPFPSDPSQTRILRVIFHHFLGSNLCIDGPPGTGKSQLICNLIANSLFHHQKVLVVCEKEVALKVIADKLTSIGLNRSIIKINDLSQTVQIYQSALSHSEKNHQEVANWEDYEFFIKQITDLEKKRMANLKKITDYYKVERSFWVAHQVSLSEVYVKLARQSQSPATIIKNNSHIKNREQLAQEKALLSSYIDKFVKIFTKWKEICFQLSHCFRENQTLDFEFNLENQNNFLEIINSLLRELKGEKTEINLISRLARLKLWQQSNQTYPSLELLKIKLKDLTELRAEKNYQKLFSFLRIENFTDFWQKLSQEAFLLKIQKFIREEFLGIGELNLLLTEQKEERKQNLLYWLDKILLHRQLEYLTNYTDIIEQAVYFNWIKAVEEDNRMILTNWNSEELNKIQQEQKTIEKQKNDLVKIILKNKQKENLDNLFTNQKLKKELSKKRKVSSLAKTFPELINYFPIWLTTPEVIASITNLPEPIFDFLVFDEASQIPLEKSVPLWARAKKCLIIGDEQQLPPTDVFQSHLENEIEMEEELIDDERNIDLTFDDLEKNASLLSYAKKSQNRPQLTLLYHYRSRYPELIEFSNQAFYNGILQIVCASEIRKEASPALEYHYQASGRWINNENQIEANYIVNLLKTLPSNKEIGIVTFNSKQRDLLIDLIGERSESNSLFVKNLEKVQGDERDIIIFSIGYARDKEGKIYLRFGPLSQAGGEKRLNVAISRAREKLIIVTSLLPSDLNRIIEEDKSRNLGPKLFKKYLEYAYYCGQNQLENAQKILEKSLPKLLNASQAEENQTEKEFDSWFEKQVYNELQVLLSSLSANYEIHKQVKSIGYRIDLAIWDNQTQQYILGIECDGEYWHRKLENIERDIYRQQLLEKGGWKIIRILSRDWWRNKNGEIERIKKEI